MPCWSAVPLPDAPLGVQVDAGPQRGTLLVTWTPVPDKKPVDADAASLMRVRLADDVAVETYCCVAAAVRRARAAASLIRAITGYAVYVDGTRVKRLDSPTGQLHAYTHGPIKTEIGPDAAAVASRRLS